MVFEKKKQIRDLEEGESVEDIYVVKIKKNFSNYSKGYRIDLILSDSSGSSLDYVFWGPDNETDVKKAYDLIKQDSVVLIKGKVGRYRDKLQLSSDSSDSPQVLKEEEYEADFIMHSKKSLNDLYEKLKEIIESISDLKLKDLLNTIFEEIGEKFKKHPGAITVHHHWVGGLLEHTLEVIEYCETTLKLFPQLNRDLLITGAILHDIGKLDELETTSRIKGSEIGQLAGHLVLGVSFLMKKLEQNELEDLTKNKLIHLLVSHHGKLEYGSPKEGMFSEAIALYYADELSSKLSEIIHYVEESKERTDDDFMYNLRHRKNIFLK